MEVAGIIGTAASTTHSGSYLSDIVISSNTITVSETDEYADYETAAVRIQGFDLEKDPEISGKTTSE